MRNWKRKTVYQEPVLLNKHTTLKGKRGFDVDLEFGKHFEELMDDIFSGVHKAEVKTERDQWLATGNIAIETHYGGNPSGLTSTLSDIWIHNLSLDGELVASIIIPVDRLRKIVEKMKQDKVGKTINGGDGWRSKLFLLPLDSLFKYIKGEAKDGVDRE